jgi:NAD(P)-dependent dehydrogenase (short-subunit alcohol dehydrogenase family)
MKIDGSVALGTGAGRGLGQVYARQLVGRGAARVTEPRVILPPSPSPA